MASIMLVMLAAFAPCPVTAQELAPKSKPNIIFILADDLSSHSIGAYGGKLYRTVEPGKPEPIAEVPVHTPSIDQMASEGLRFNYALAAPCCSPTRGMILTGKYNFRIGLPDLIGRAGSVKELDVTKHITLPQLLQKEGYVTAMAGKWHLSSSTEGEKMEGALKDNPNPHISAAGFQRQYQHKSGMTYSGYPDRSTGEFKADWIQAWVLKFLDEQAECDKPFFLYYPHPMAHYPWDKTPDSKTIYDNPGESGIAYFGDHVTYLDKHVGQVIEKVRKLGLAENTLIIFSGDNGTDRALTVMADGSYARGGKNAYGQSARVPLIAWWPSTIQPGTVRDDLVDASDYLPTLMDVAGVPLPQDADIDGVSFRGALLGKAGSARDWIMSYRSGAFIIRDQRYGLREDGRLYDLTKSDFDGGAIQESSMNTEVRDIYDRFRAVATKYQLPYAQTLKK